MSRPVSSAQSPILGGGLIAAAVLTGYHNIFTAPFVYLDLAAIQDNPSIRTLWPLWRALWPSRLPGITVEGRPVLNLSLAVNYAVSGTAAWSYHAVNVLIHLAAALVLFGLLRRTGAHLRQRGGDFIAFGSALLWAVHPLQTESVTYSIQRAESLMGLFYLLTFYGFLRFWESSVGSWKWAGLTFSACLLGMGTKEVMVSAPVMVLLYDRMFLSGSFGAAWRRSGRLYLALAATWILLGAFVLSTGGNRGGTSGFGLEVSFGQYLLTQFPAIAHYLRLAVWPHPLIFYYPVEWTSFAAAAPTALIVVGLAAASVAAFYRGSALGFLGLFFFAILAPTSLVPGMSQTLAEHRMYLALIPVMIVLVAGLERIWPERAAARSGLLVVGALVLVFLTVRRNHVYRSEVALWADTVAKAPTNPYSQNNLGIALVSAQDQAEAILHFRRALALNPAYPEAHDNLGLALAQTGHVTEAIAQYGQALALKPDYPEALANLGVALAGLGRMPEALGRLQRAVEIDPAYAAARNDLGVVLAASGQPAEAVAQYAEALRLAPGNAETHYNLANALAGLGRWPEAAAHYERALQLRSAYVEAWANLGVALAQSGRLPEAVARYEEALRLAPGDPEVQDNLGLALQGLGRTSEAEAHFAIARQLRSRR